MNPKRKSILDDLAAMIPAEHDDFIRRIHAPMTDEERASINDDVEGDADFDLDEEMRKIEERNQRAL